MKCELTSNEAQFLLEALDQQYNIIATNHAAEWAQMLRDMWPPEGTLMTNEFRRKIDLAIDAHNYAVKPKFDMIEAIRIKLLSK